MNQRHLLRALIAVAVSCAAAFCWTARAQNESYAIRNVRIVPVTAPIIEKGTVVVSSGRIAAVGASVSVPAGAKVIDGTDLSVYPGMIDAGTVLGLTEVSSISGTVDTSEIGENNADIHVDVA